MSENNQFSKPQILERKTVFVTDFFEIVAKTVNKDDISDAPYYALNPRDYVCILALTEQGSIILVKQYRPVVEEVTLELPAGLVEDNETPAEAAKRELLEETGFLTDDVEFLGCLFTDTGRIDNRTWCYFADNVKNREDSLEPDKRLETVVSSLANFRRKIDTGEFRHALHIAALFLAQIQGKLLLHGKEKV